MSFYDRNVPAAMAPPLYAGALNELKLFAEIYAQIPERYFDGRNQKKTMMTGEKQVILSCWLQNFEAL